MDPSLSETSITIPFKELNTNFWWQWQYVVLKSKRYFVKEKFETPNIEIKYLNADMMHSSSLVFLQKTFNWTVISQWMQQLHLGVSQVDKNNRHSMLRNRDRLTYLGPQNILIKCLGFFQVRHCNCYMIESTQVPHRTCHLKRGLWCGKSTCFWNRSLKFGKKPWKMEQPLISFFWELTHL